MNPPYFAYTVQPGDSLRFIASAYGVSTASIASASGLTDADHLRVGQVLTIPRQPGWLYRLQPGETLEQVAARTGLAPETIQTASGFPLDKQPKPGDVLLIPTLPAAGK